MPPPNARITPTAETMPPRNTPRSSRHRKAPPRDACCSKRDEAVPSQSERAPSGTRAGQSHSEIATLAAKQRNLAPRLRQTVRRGVFSPNGAMHAMGRRDAPSKAKRHDAGRRGVSAVLAGCFRGQRGGSPVLTPQPSLAATKHTRTKPHASKQTRAPSKQTRAPSKETARPAMKQTPCRSQQAGPLC